MRLILNIKDHAAKSSPTKKIFIGVHEQASLGNPYPLNSEFLAYEFGWHPKYGNDHVNDIVDKARDVMNVAGPAHIPVHFFEYNIFINDDIAREESLGLNNAFRYFYGNYGIVFGIGGPWREDQRP